MRLLRNPRSKLTSFAALVFGVVSAAVVLVLVVLQLTPPARESTHLEAYRLLASYNALAEAAERAAFDDVQNVIPSFVIDGLSGTLQSLDDEPYKDVVDEASLGQAVSAMNALVEDLRTPSEDRIPAFTIAEIAAFRMDIERIAKVVSDENYRNNERALRALRQSEQNIIWFAIALIVACALYVIVFAYRNQKLATKTLELQLSESKLQQLSFYRQQFLANMSHEFRTPLNAIRGFAEAMLYQKDTITPEMTQEYAGYISKSATDLTKLTEDVLDLSKIDAGKFELYLEDVDLTELINETMLQFREVAAQKDIRIDVEIAQNWLISCDQLAVKRCITNLISNALKFSTPGSRVLLNVRLRDPQVFCVEVRDFGCGIPEGELQSIWMVYSRSSNTRKTDREGAGLGLAMVKALMSSHKGFVELQSKEGVGTSARLCFPTAMIVASRPLAAHLKNSERFSVRNGAQKFIGTERG